MKPYYQDGSVTIYHADCREILSRLARVELALTDPPYPNNAGHFDEHVRAACDALVQIRASRFMVFWHQLQVPPVAMPLVAHHIWHRTNTNRPNNYEAIYEFAEEGERASIVFPFAVIAEGLTGCKEATGHPTQKSVKLMQRLIRLRNAASVLDPFMGSGSTLEAAKKLGIPAIGIEIEERYCEIAAKRCAQDLLNLDWGKTADSMGYRP